MEEQRSSANSIRIREVVLTWLARWDCNLLFPLGMVILNTPVE